MPASKKERQSAKERIQRTEAYANKVRQQFAGAVNDILALNKRLPELKEGQMYSFDGAGKKMRSEVDSILRELHSVTVATVRTGITQEWAEANKAVDEILASALGRRALSNPNLAGWFDRNEKAMDAFLKRTQDGFNLSRRIWNTTTQLREEMEVAMTVAIGEGESASEMSRRVRQYLNDPDLMFRRFRYKDEDGNWQRKWKKKVVDSDGHYHFVDYDRDSYKVGRGMYKSAYKNAMRATRTETNIAYRRADHERWQQLDFVLGQRIQTSNSHPKEDICDELAGDYPKDFVFDGWHPQCFCICTPIMADEEEMKKEMEAVLAGEDYEPNYKPITTYPEGFQKFVEENAKGISNSLKAGTAPYFVANNEEVVRRIMEGEDLTHKLTAKEIADIRHANRTQADIDDIKQRWAKTKEEHEQIRTDAKDALELAKEYHEVDTAELEKQTKDDDLTFMKRQTEELQKAIEEQKEEEKKLADIIPDVHKWHQQFTLEQLRGVHDAVEKKLDGWSSLTLQQQAKKLNFEAYEYFGKNMNDVQSKYSTWEVSQASYIAKLGEVNYKIDTDDILASVGNAVQWSSQNKKYTKLSGLIADMQSAISKGESVASVQAKADLVQAEYNKKSVAKMAKFNTGDFTQARKDNALWDTAGGAKANDALFDVASNAWQNAKKGQKDAIFGYTKSYCCINEPLQGRTYIGKQTRSAFERKVDNITSYIGMNKLPQDMWFQRGDNGLDVIALRLIFNGQTVPSGIISGNNLQALVGMEMQEGGFLSTGSAKDKGFLRNVTLNIYAPKGTQAAYVEPFSHYGWARGLSNGGRNWDGVTKFTQFGTEFETIFQRGTKMRITKAYYDNGRYFIDCEVVGQEIKDLSYVSNSQIGY